MKTPKYRRILLKVSGEALAGDKGFGQGQKVVNSVARQIQEVVELGTEVAIIVGGGNFWRGLRASSRGVDRATADYIGMLATVMNSLALQDSFEKMEKCSEEMKISRAEVVRRGVHKVYDDLKK